MTLGNWLAKYAPVYAPDGDEVAGSDPAGGDPAGGDPAGGDDPVKDPSAVDPEPDVWRPEGIPDRLQGQSDRETAEKLYKDWQGQHEKLSSLGTIPKDADGYELKLSEDAQKLFPIGDDDKLVPLVKEVALKHGLNTDMIGAFSDFVDGAIAAGIVEKPASMDDVHRAAAPADFSGSDAERIAAGQKRMDSMEAQIDGMVAAQGLTKEEAAEAKLLLTTSPGLSMLQKFLNAGVQSSVNPGGQDSDKQSARAEAMKNLQSPKATPGDPSYDPAYAKQWDDRYKSTFS